MSDKSVDNIKSILQGRKRSAADVDDMHMIQMERGKRPKRTIDMTRTNQNYYKTQVVQKDLLEHYENVDWHERSHEFDFSSYMEKH